MFFLLAASPSCSSPAYSLALMITGALASGSAGREAGHVGDSHREGPHAIIYQPDLPAGQGSQTLKYWGSEVRLFIIDTLPPRWADALLPSQRRSDCISCLPGSQVKALCLGMVSSSPAPDALCQLDKGWLSGDVPRRLNISRWNSKLKQT